jgi:hypothetical protein
MIIISQIDNLKMIGEVLVLRKFFRCGGETTWSIKLGIVGTIIYNY